MLVETKLSPELAMLCVEQMGDRIFNRGTDDTAVVLNPVYHIFVHGVFYVVYSFLVMLWRNHLS